MRRVIALLIFSCLLFTFCACAAPEPEEQRPSYTVTLTAPEAGKEISLVNPDIRMMLNHYVRRESVKEQYGLGDHYMPNTVALKWTFDGTPSGYTVELARDEAFTNAMQYDTKRTTQVVTNLYTSSSYFWRVTAHTSDGDFTSSVGTFTTCSGVRTVSVDGVSNIRDIGGLLTTSGNRLRQGLVYRSATLDTITATGLKAAKDLFIKTELDLRKDGEGTVGHSMLGSGVRYVHISAPYYYYGTTGLSSASSYESFAEELRLFSDADNLPILFHCSVGRDRTGTLAFILELLCGVTEDNLFIDYELSFLSQAGCLDNAGVDTMYGQLMPLYEYLKQYASGDIYQNTERFVKEKLGLTDREIKAIRTNLIE